MITTTIAVTQVISAGEEKLHTQANAFLRGLNSDGHQLLQAALKVGECLKDCFVVKNADGYCFDRERCQPKIEVNEAKRTLKKCSKEVGWKKEVVELCECAIDAGV